MATMMEANHHSPALGALGLGSSLLLALAAVVLPGCGGRTAPQAAPEEQEVSIYVALDEHIARPILKDFTQESGIEVRMHGDSGDSLAKAIEAASGKPTFDLLWNDDPLQTLLLERQGLLRGTTLAQASHYDAKHRSAVGAWYQFASQARVLIVNTRQLNESRYPKSIDALADPQWRDRVGVAKPVGGTSATHVACLFVALGDDEAKRLVKSIKNNARLLSSNRDVAARVADNTLAFGLTDSGAAMAEIEAGSPVAIVYPDQREGELGTLFLPHTLAFLKGGQHPEAADRLGEYLLSAPVEDRLAEGPTAAVPLNNKSQATARIETPQTVKAMEIDFHAAADKWEVVEGFLEEEFGAGR